MSLVIDKNGTISLYQGDSGEILVSGLDNSRNCVVYFGIQDKKRKPIGNELQVTANKTDSVIFFLTPDYTNLLKVPANKPYEMYTYGIKVCESSNNIEDTLFISNNTYGEQNIMIVYPQKVAGG